MKLSEVIERVKTIAMEKSPGSSSVFEQSDVYIELLLPMVFEDVTFAFANDPDKLQSLRSQQTVGITSGVSTNVLPDGVDERYASAMFIEEDPDASYEQNWLDYMFREYDYFGVFHLKNNKLHYRPAYMAPTGFTGNITLNTVMVPQLPAIGSDVAAPALFLNKAIEACAERLVARGK